MCLFLSREQVTIAGMFRAEEITFSKEDIIKPKDLNTYMTVGSTANAF